VGAVDTFRYPVHAVTAGLDAQGEVSVTIEEAGRRVIGNGVHEDVMVASAPPENPGRFSWLIRWIDWNAAGGRSSGMTALLSASRLG